MARESKGAEALLVTARSDAAGRYRCDHAREQLRLQGIDAAVLDLLDPALQAALAGCRLAIFHRVGLDRHTERLYRRVSESGGLAVYDTDDLIFDAGAALEVPHRRYGNDRVRAAWVREEAQAQRRAIERADAVLVATEYLAEEARKFGTPTWVYRNAFSLEMLRLSEEARTEETQGNGPPETRRRIIIGYASGTPTHDEDFRVAKPTLLRMLERYEDLELWLAGPVNPGGGWDAVQRRIRRTPLVPWERLPRMLARFDINIVPLKVAARFCRAKSEVKYIEAGLVGVPTIASRGAGFDHAIRSGDNGLLARTHEDWLRHLETLVRDVGLRTHMGERARADVLMRYHPVVRGRDLLRALNDMGRTIRGRPLWAEGDVEASGTEALERRPRGRALAAVRREPVGTVGLVRRGLHSLRHRGVRIFLMELWIYARGWWRGLLELSPRS